VRTVSTFFFKLKLTKLTVFGNWRFSCSACKWFGLFPKEKRKQSLLPLGPCLPRLHDYLSRDLYCNYTKNLCACEVIIRMVHFRSFRNLKVSQNINWQLAQHFFNTKSDVPSLKYITMKLHYRPEFKLTTVCVNYKCKKRDASFRFSCKKKTNKQTKTKKKQIAKYLYKKTW